MTPAPPPPALPALPALPAVEDALRARLGTRVRITASQPARGGDIHTALCIDTAEGTRFFVKLAAAAQLPMFEAEADGLAAIAASASLRTPAVIACGASEGHAFLILEHLDLRPLQSAADGARFAEALVALHRDIDEHFGWTRDNFIGRTPQANDPRDNWARFVVEQRLRPQFALARNQGADNALLRQGESLFERVPALFLDYRPQPSLLHGDLWHGNAALLADGTPVVFDPAVHRGDREADLAMSELFGGFPSTFYAAYRKAWPLHEDYEQRKQLYSLYHVLNHLNLFGRAYLREALRLATRLNETLGRKRE
jgi:fructosamine-3-kinase